MPTKKQLQKIRGVFSPSPKAEAKTKSAIAIAKAVIHLDILEQHKKKMLTEVQWLISEAHGKYTTKYRSLGSILDGNEALQHEHVFPRKKLSMRILEDPSNVQKYLDEVIGCVVTKDEHDKLSSAEKQNPELDGWARYRAAGIEVYDMEQNPPQKVQW